MNSENFDTHAAFSRNLGWLTKLDQKIISQVRVGIAGLGGVGGQYAEILARIGVQHFTLCDGDTFSIENTNRQNQCQVSNYGKNKAEVIADLIKDINPAAEVKLIKKAMDLDSLNQFCDDLDIYLDGLDFFETNLRIPLFRQLREKKKPAITVAPLGAGAAALVFTDTSMSFDDYFGLHLTEDPVERSYRFLLGLAPSLQHRHYIADRSVVNLRTQKVPSLAAGVYGAASLMAGTFLKVALKRGPLLQAPSSFHVDMYLNCAKTSYLWWGHRNPLFKIKLLILKNIIKS